MKIIAFFYSGNDWKLKWNKSICVFYFLLNFLLKNRKHMINLIKYVQDLHTKNYKMLIRKKL